MLGYTRNITKQACRFYSSAFHPIPSVKVDLSDNIISGHALLKQPVKDQKSVKIPSNMLAFTNSLDILTHELGNFEINLPYQGNTLPILPPVVNTTVYKDPTVPENPMVDPSTSLKIDNVGVNNSPVYAHKNDLYWRRRRMRRHRLVRWRKKHKDLVQKRFKRKIENRRRKFNEDLQGAWEQFGLTRRPPQVSKDEEEKYTKEWRESGLLVDILSRDEVLKFAKIQSVRHQTDFEMKQKRKNRKRKR